DRTPPTKGSVYGSTSYSVALAYGLKSDGLRRVPAHGSAVTEAPVATGGVSGPPDAYAYVVDWRDLNAPRVLAALLRQDVRVRAADRADGGGRQRLRARLPGRDHGGAIAGRRRPARRCRHGRTRGGSGRPRRLDRPKRRGRRSRQRQRESRACAAHRPDHGRG